MAILVRSTIRVTKAKVTFLGIGVNIVTLVISTMTVTKEKVILFLGIRIKMVTLVINTMTVTKAKVILYLCIPLKRYLHPAGLRGVSDGRISV